MPAAALVVAGFLLATVLIVAMLMVGMVVLSATRQARGAALGLPLVGGTVGGALASFELWVLMLMTRWAGTLGGQLWSVLLHVKTLTWYAVGDAIGGLHAGLELVTRQAADLLGWVNAWEQLRLPVLVGQLAAVDARVDQLRDQVAIPAAQLAQHLELVEVPELRAQQLLQAQQLSELSGFLPLLQDLARLPLGPAGTLRDLQRRQLQGEADAAGLEALLEGTRARLRGLEDLSGADHATLGSYARLAVLATLSSVALAELARIGRNPCGVCEGLDLSDLGDRVEALEGMGS